MKPKEIRYEKVVEWKSDKFNFISCFIVLFLYYFIFGFLADSFFNYPRWEMSVIVLAIILVIYLLLTLSDYFNNRKVYWRQIK